MPSFTCSSCGSTFQVSAEALAKYPGWTPRSCMRCRNQPNGAARQSRERTPRAARVGAGGASREENLTVAEVLQKYSEGPGDGVFTDGASHPNPGPGGWGAVYVVSGEIVAQRHGHEPHTTNNRMELRALIEGSKLVPAGTATVLWTDSQLCVKTINEWAAGWKARGWKKKDGEVKNLELVQELYAIFQSRPELELRWIQAHSGLRWNEYADSLASAYRRDTL